LLDGVTNWGDENLRFSMRDLFCHFVAGFSPEGASSIKPKVITALEEVLKCGNGEISLFQGLTLLTNPGRCPGLYR